jgi:hypothetical protein
MSDSVATTSRYFTAVVHADDGVRFVASAATADALAAELAAYVSERCDDVLWPAVAQRVRSLLDRSDFEAAVAIYFENVGDRWDTERLERLHES